MNLNPVDIVIGLIWIYFLFTGIKSGFILQLAQIISIVVGYICANTFHLHAYELLSPYIENPTARNVLAYISIFLIIVILVQIIAKIINQLFKLVLLGWLNKILGLLLGGLKGLFITSLIIFTLEAFPETLDLRAKLKKESILYGICNSLKNWTIQSLSNEEIMFHIQQEMQIKTDENYIQELLEKTRS
ncbi:MAG: hypothetical protein CMF96_11255 [Candidatus Marinimicrobia bacterium]|nr:hypothetical protein [Candidatus Neomarinimicrobiota bacterium]